MFDDTRGGGGNPWDGWGDEFRDFLNRPRHYVLDGRTPIPCGDFLKWAQWFETADRHVGLRCFKGLGISTIFLGHDNAMTGPPLLFETGVFIGGRMVECWRMSTYAEAVERHREGVEMAQCARHARALARQPWDLRMGLRWLYWRRYEPETS